MRLPRLLSLTFCLSFLRCEAGHTMGPFTHIDGVGPGVFTGVFDGVKFFTVGEGQFRVSATVIDPWGDNFFVGLYAYHGAVDGRIDVGDSMLNGLALHGDYELYASKVPHVLTVYMGSFDGVSLWNEENIQPGWKPTYWVQIDDITNAPDSGSTGLVLAAVISFLIFAGRKHGAAAKRTLAAKIAETIPRGHVMNREKQLLRIE